MTTSVATPQNRLCQNLPEARISRQPTGFKDVCIVVIIGGGGRGLTAAHYFARHHSITDVAGVQKGYMRSGELEETQR